MACTIWEGGVDGMNPVEATTAEPAPSEPADEVPCPGCVHLHYDNTCCRCGKPEHNRPRP